MKPNLIPTIVFLPALLSTLQCANSVAEPRPAGEAPPTAAANGQLVAADNPTAKPAAAPGNCPEHCRGGSPDVDDDAIYEVPIANAPVRGQNDAPVTIVLFSDFECPFCVKAAETLRQVEAANPGKVKVAFRQRPLPFHTHARLAAKASIAAERQGKFWAYHDILVQHREALERTDLEGYAREAGLDVGRFSRDLDAPETEARVAADEKDAEALHVTGTPTAFVNGKRVLGAQPLPVWLQTVQRNLSK